MHFCGNCGAPLVDESDLLPAAATQNPAEALGILVGSDLKQRFHRAGLESAGQRRTVTVLFADLCDYTGLSNQLDDESLYELIQTYINMLAEKVYQHEGMVDKITGDGLMALFGAPIALENPAERAVRAAIEMQNGLETLNQELEKRLGEKLQMHWGLNRGSVIVGGIGSDLLIDYTAIGDSVNLARRLQEAASPDTILVSESVYQTTQAIIDYQSVPGLELKGYQDKITGYKVKGVKEKPELVRGIQGLHAPLVGREVELHQLIASLKVMLETGRGQFVTLVGEAGIGKSRLTQEFKSRLDGNRVFFLEGQSLTYRKSVSYWIFLEVLRNYLGVHPGAQPAELQSELFTRVSSLLGDESSRVLPLFEKLLNLEPSDPVGAQRLNYLGAEQLRNQSFIAIRNLLLAIADQGPLVLILEDLHWADETSLDLLSFLLEAIDERSIMVLAITRPVSTGKLAKVLDDAQQQLGENSKSIHLASLSEEHSQQLLRSLLGMPDIPDQIRFQVTNRASGVPFYIEETLRMLIDKQILFEEAGTWIVDAEVDLNLEVPDNLQDLILARFDRLTSVQRNLLQTASVIGREFNLPLLKKVLDYSDEQRLKQILSSLEEKAFILPAAEQTSQSYLFRHVLTSDAVYQTMLRRDRNKLHGLVAESIEQVYEGQLENQVEVLAGHYLRSEYLDKALHYMILAGRKSAREYANQQAQQYFLQARTLLDQVEYSPGQAWQVWIGLGDVQVFIGEYDQARSSYREIIQSNLVEEEDISEFGLHEVYRKIATTYERQGEFERALEQLAIAGEHLQAQVNSTPVANAQILNDRGWILFLKGNFPEARSNLQFALELVAGSEELSVVASINNRLGAVSYQMREYKRAAQYVRESLALRKILGDLSGEARLYNNLGLLGLMSGDLLDAEQDFYQSITLLEKVGDTEGIALANINLGLVKFDLGDYDPARNHFEKAILVSQKIGHRFYLGLAELYLGRLESAEAGYDRAEELFNESRAIFEELGAQDNLVDVFCYQAENYLAWGKNDAAILWSKDAGALLESEAGNLSLESVQSGRVLRLQGSIARQQGQVEQAEFLLQESAAIFKAALEKLESARTAFELGQLAVVCDQPARAQTYFMQAKKTFSEVGAKKELERLDSFLEAATA